MPTKSNKVNYFSSAASLLWQYYFALQFGLTLLFCYPILVWAFQKPKRYPHALRLQRIWAAYLLLVTGIRLQIIGQLPSPQAGPVVFTPNHRNFLDILLMYSVVRSPFHFMAKAVLAKLPMFGILFSKTHIPFNRQSSSASSWAFRRALADLKRGISLVVFPEATQNPSSASLLPFKEGAFKLAEEANVPVVGVYFENNLQRLPHPKNLFRWPGQGGPGQVRVRIMPPVSGPASYTQQAVRRTMEAWLAESMNKENQS